MWGFQQCSLKVQLPVQIILQQCQTPNSPKLSQVKFYYKPKIIFLILPTFSKVDITDLTSSIHLFDQRQGVKTSSNPRHDDIERTLKTNMKLKEEKGLEVQPQETKTRFPVVNILRGQRRCQHILAYVLSSSDTECDHKYILSKIS